MASKLSGWVEVAVGAALVAGTIFTGGALSPALASFLISAGSGVALSGIGSLIAGLGAVKGVHTLARNPVKSWDVVYGRARVSGTNIYTYEWGDNNKYIDIVAVLACHPCQNVYALLFNGRMVQIDTTAVPAGVPASTWPAINGGTSFTPAQETQNISAISRANNVVTVTTANFPLMLAGEYVIISGVTTDPTLNGTFPVAQILEQQSTPTNTMIFTYICGGAGVSIGAQGTVKSTWVDYGRHVYIETMMGNQTLGSTFVGMTIGTPNEGDPSDLQHPSTNPWTANCSAVGRTVVFLRLNYDSTIFANGIPEISFLIHGKNNILDPRPSPATTGYTENSALCFADYMTNQDYGYRCSYGTEIDIDDLITDANVCDELVTLAAGGTEPRYTCNGQFELSMTRGEILQHLLSSCGGRLTNSTGQFRCNPAAWAGTSLVLAAPNPSGTPGWGGAVTGAGWTPRIDIANNDRLSTWDALAPTAGSYPGTADWPGRCNVINILVLESLAAGGGLAPASVQANGSASALNGSGFSTYTIAFGSANTAGNTLVVDVTFNTGYPLSGVTVTDSLGNFYWPLFMAHVPGSASFLCTFVAIGCDAGTPTVTITQTGSFNFQAISVSLQEYSGIDPQFPQVVGVAVADGSSTLYGVPYASWMYGSPITFNGTQYSIAGAGTGYVPGTLTPNAAISGRVPTTHGVAEPWTLGYPPEIGYYACPAVCNSQVNFNGGPAANTLTDSVFASNANSVLRLIAGTLPDCAGVVVGGGVPATVGPMQIAANPFRWKPKVSVHDLFNAVKGTYVSPLTNWQVTDFPPYMQDSIHGYYSGSPLYPYGDANLAADDGLRRYLDIQLPFTISVATAQRLAKLELMRRRQQGTGTFQFNLYAVQMAVLDVVSMTLPFFSWVGKLLEIVAWRFTLTPNAGGVIALGTEIDVQETDPSVYAWYPGMEELTPQGYGAPSTGGSVTSIVGPTSGVLLSDGTTAVIGANGIAQSQIEVSWTAPADGYAAYIQIQYQVAASPPGTVWIAGPTVQPNVTTAFIPNVVNGTSYYVQIRSVDVNGAASPWVQYGPVTAGGATSQLFTVNGS